MLIATFDFLPEEGLGECMLGKMKLVCIELVVGEVHFYLTWLREVHVYMNLLFA